VLLGLLVMVTRRNAVSQVVGFMSLENGLVLAATGAKGMPLVVEISGRLLDPDRVHRHSASSCSGSANASTPWTSSALDDFPGRAAMSISFFDQWRPSC